MSTQRGVRTLPLMSLSRFEAFSDGVFAIAMTLLVIEVKHPDLAGVTPVEAVGRLLGVWPQVLSYVTSFGVLGVIWLNHHALFHFLKRVGRGALVINLRRASWLPVSGASATRWRIWSRRRSPSSAHTSASRCPC